MPRALSLHMKLQIARLQLEIGHRNTACTPGSAMLDISGEIKTGLDSAYRHLRELMSAPPHAARGLQPGPARVVDELEARAGTGVSLDFRLGSQPLTANEEFHLLPDRPQGAPPTSSATPAPPTVVHLAPLPGGGWYAQIEDDGRGIAPGRRRRRPPRPVDHARTRSPAGRHAQ